MIKLRHINGANLKDLERQLEMIELPIIVQQINKVGSNWYIHFLVQSIQEEKKKVRVEKSKKTKTLRS